MNPSLVSAMQTIDGVLTSSWNDSECSGTDSVWLKVVVPL